jgi:putative ABC transport system ATP-binding protein
MRILNQIAQRAQTAVIAVPHEEKTIPTFRRIYDLRDRQTVKEADGDRSL